MLKLSFFSFIFAVISSVQVLALYSDGTGGWGADEYQTWIYYGPYGDHARVETKAEYEERKKHERECPRNTYPWRSSQNIFYPNAMQGIQH